MFSIAARCTGHAQTRQRSGPAVPDDAVVIENLLELGGGGTGLSGCEIRLSTNVGWIEAGEIAYKQKLPVLDGWQGRLQAVDRGRRIFVVECQLRLNRGQPKRLHLRY